jgi:sugar phosphate permease
MNELELTSHNPTQLCCNITYVAPPLACGLVLLCGPVLQVHYGWNGYFTAMIGACVVSLALMVPLANAKSYVQTQAESKQAA